MVEEEYHAQVQAYRNALHWYNQIQQHVGIAAFNVARYCHLEFQTNVDLVLQ